MDNVNSVNESRKPFRSQLLIHFNLLKSRRGTTGGPPAAVPGLLLLRLMVDFFG